MGPSRSERHMWFYDGNQLNTGNLVITGITHEQTVVYSRDLKTDKIVWKEYFDVKNTHDVDLINGDQLLIANMRSYNGSTGKNDDRIVIYDRSKDDFV